MSSLKGLGRKGKLIYRGFGLAFFYNEGDTLSMSIDITNICNLECRGCYYYSKPYEETMLTEDQWIDKIREVKKKYPGIIHCTWVGGEPLLRKKFLERGIKEFDLNWVVTNGTLPFPDWRGEAVFAVSIDGTKEHHDRIRSHNKTFSA